MTIINFRVDDNLKKSSEKIFSELGLNMTTALTIFLKSVVRNNGIPFPLEIPNKKTLKAFDEVDKISQGRIATKKYKNTSDLKKDLKL